MRQCQIQVNLKEYFSSNTSNKRRWEHGWTFYRFSNSNRIGNTTCPQQYEGLSDLLAQQGYDVYVPLLPGHGRRYLAHHPNTFNGKGDDIALMPGQYELERYYAFSERMSQLLAPESQERISWGTSCKQERLSGRSGYCEFNLTHVSAVQKPGRSLLSKLSNIQQPVQIIGIEQDSAASNAAIAEAHRHLPNNHTCLNAIVIFPKKQAHTPRFILPILTLN